MRLILDVRAPIEVNKSIAIATLALAMAVAALVISTINRTSPTDDSAVRAQVDAALKARELKLVGEFAPKMEEIYRDMLGSSEEVYETQPETFAELIAPLVRVIEGIASED
ncbi:MAG: hypothetical protein VCA55_01965 [Verrucomicrobiales bacterium]